MRLAIWRVDKKSRAELPMVFFDHRHADIAVKAWRKDARCNLAKGLAIPGRDRKWLAAGRSPATTKFDPAQHLHRAIGGDVLKGCPADIVNLIAKMAKRRKPTFKRIVGAGKFITV